MTAQDLKRFCSADAAADQLLEAAMTKLGLSARAYTRTLKVARTIADLDGANDIGAAQVAGAIQYRSLDRSFLAPHKGTNKRDATLFARQTRKELRPHLAPGRRVGRKLARVALR